MIPKMIQSVFILTIIRNPLYWNYGQNLFLFKYFHKTCTDMHHKHKSICMIFCYGDFFLIGIHYLQGWTATAKHWVTRKRSTGRFKHTGSLFRKNLQLKDVS